MTVDQLIMRDCGKCEHHRRLGSKLKGVRIPGGFGKCIRPGGLCEDHIPAKGIGGAGSSWRKKSGGSRVV